MWAILIILISFWKQQNQRSLSSHTLCTYKLFQWVGETNRGFKVKEV